MWMRSQRGSPGPRSTDDALGGHRQFGQVQASGAADIKNDRKKDADQNAKFDVDGEGGERRRQHDLHVEARAAQVIHQLLAIDQPPGGDEQDARQRGARDIAGQRGEQQHRQRDGDRREDARPLADGAGLHVDRRARQRPGTGEALKEAADEVRQPFAEALLIDVELLPGARGNRLGHRDRFEQSKHRDGQRAADQAGGSATSSSPASAAKAVRKGIAPITSKLPGPWSHSSNRTAAAISTRTIKKSGNCDRSRLPRRA